MSPDLYAYYDLIDSAPSSSGFDAEAAYDFLRLHGDPINNIRLAHWRGSVDDEQFWRVMGQHQASNGGFKGGLDPDYWGEVGSIHSTIEAMRIMVAHHQHESAAVGKVAQFIRQSMLPDGTWQELPRVFARGLGACMQTLLWVGEEKVNAMVYPIKDASATLTPGEGGQCTPCQRL